MFAQSRRRHLWTSDSHGRMPSAPSIIRERWTGQDDDVHRSWHVPTYTTSTAAAIAQPVAIPEILHRPDKSDVHHDVASATVTSNSTASAARGTRRSWPCRVCNRALSTPSNRKRHERAKHPLSDAARLDGRFVHPHFDSRTPESGEDIEDLPPPSRSWSRSRDSVHAQPAAAAAAAATVFTESSHASGEQEIARCHALRARGTKKRKTADHAEEVDCTKLASARAQGSSNCKLTNLAACAADVQLSHCGVMPEPKRIKPNELEVLPPIARDTACDDMMLDSESQPLCRALACSPTAQPTDERKYDSEDSLRTDTDDDDFVSSSSEFDSHSSRASELSSSFPSQTRSGAENSSESEYSASTCARPDSVSSCSSSNTDVDSELVPSESDDEPPQRRTVAAAATAAAAATINGVHGNSSATSPVPSSSVDWTELSSLPGVPQPLEPTTFYATCEPFITWLSQPPITQSEAMVKARRVRNPSQVIPIRNNLRFLLVTLHDQLQQQPRPANSGHPIKAAAGVAEDASGEPRLEAFTHLHVCQSLFDIMVKRHIGSARVHALFLLVKKVLVYLSSVASLKQRQYIAPVTFPSFFYVDSICADASLQRKQEARNRSLLGMQAAPFRLHAHGRESGPSTAANEAPATVTVGHQVGIPPLRLPTVQEEPSMSLPGKASHAAVAPRTASVRSTECLTKQDLQKLASGCLAQLHDRQRLIDEADAHEQASSAACKAVRKQYVKYLATATLCLGLAPRSQVLRELQLGTTLVKSAEDGRYWVKMLAELNKNGKPCMMAFPAVLTQPYDYYFEHVRPQLLSQSPTGHLKAASHSYVFLKRDGQAPRSEFSTWTTAVTMQLIGRPINAHAFRAGVITAFYENGASQSDMDVLASLMAHDSATAKTHYFRPQFAQAAVRTNDQMTRLLLPTTPGPGPHHADLEHRSQKESATSAPSTASTSSDSHSRHPSMQQQSHAMDTSD